MRSLLATALILPLLFLTACQNTPIDVQNARGSGISSLVPLSQQALLDKAPVVLPTIGLKILSIDPQSGAILCQRSRKITEDVTDTGYIGIFLTPQNSTTTGVEVVSRSRVPLYLLGSHANDLIGHSLESQIIMTLQRP